MIAIGRVKRRYSVFVIETGDYDLVLGQSFLNFIKFCQEYKQDRKFGTIKYPYMLQKAVICILICQDPGIKEKIRSFLNL